MVTELKPNFCASVAHIGSANASWGYDRLNWYIEAAIPSLRNEQHGMMREVFDAYEKVCGLKFNPVTNPNRAHLIYSVGRRGPRSQFDGPMGTLAYAYLPPRKNYRGSGLYCYFDLDEDWEGDILFRNVAAHELGHQLGLSHSPANDGRADLMDPTYNRRIAVPQGGDIRRLVDRYGQPVAVPPESQPKPEVPGDKPEDWLELALRMKVGDWEKEIDLLSFLDKNG